MGSNGEVLINLTGKMLSCFKFHFLMSEIESLFIFLTSAVLFVSHLLISQLYFFSILYIFLYSVLDFVVIFYLLIHKNTLNLK